MSERGIRVLPRSYVYPCDAVLFDLDGTLADTSLDLWAALQQALQDSHLSQIDHQIFLDTLHFGIEDSVGHILRHLSADCRLSASLVASYKCHYQEINHQRSRLYDAVGDMLYRFKSAGLKLAICTNKESNFSIDLLKKLDVLHYFDVVVGIDQVENPKPAPEGLIYAATLMEIHPKKCVFVGDSHLDAEASAAAGMPFLLHSRGYGSTCVKLNTVASCFEHFSQLELDVFPGLRCG
ncbi:MAG: HAD-IA family hydrolase [Burkholderiaceae bacterium]|nr:HAD-IA family hydrolase [Burkholderiaceae bacterium]MCD8515881.1 HAD-IA family hydrolase [Burkholderiaceae bacterium]MCD8538098.1 HAD-IA family hydrolase [Burkholderiaceae bacterium]MCD8565705.1 HAD-IA family hydrolase [Burkholderiaceae bacterium]